MVGGLEGGAESHFPAVVWWAGQAPLLWVLVGLHGPRAVAQDIFNPACMVRGCKRGAPKLLPLAGRTSACAHSNPAHPDRSSLVALTPIPPTHPRTHPRTHPPSLPPSQPAIGAPEGQGGGAVHRRRGVRAGRGRPAARLHQGRQPLHAAGRGGGDGRGRCEGRGEGGGVGVGLMCGWVAVWVGWGWAGCGGTVGGQCSGEGEPAAMMPRCALHCAPPQDPPTRCCWCSYSHRPGDCSGHGRGGGGSAEPGHRRGR